MTRTVNRIVVHCSYTKPSMGVGVAEIRRWHVDGNGWSDIGYHWVIRRDGLLEQGRPVTKPGAHVAGHNEHTIGICLVGGMAEAGGVDCNFTFAQFKTLHALTAKLRADFPDVVDVVGHRDLDNGKECPCIDVAAFFSA